jgi:LysW-gamma-L-lysine carboxypeptidase
MASREVQLLHEMLLVPSPSGHEADLARFLLDAARDLGLASSIDEAGNFRASAGTGAGPTVLMLGHMDTVDDPIPVRLLGDRLAGRGAVDAKGPLAAMLLATAARPHFPGRLEVVGAVEEEVPGSRGAEYLRRTMARPDAVLIGEPSGWSNVVLGYKGILDLGYRVSRPATHPTNPIQKATEVAAAFWADAWAELGPHASHAAFDLPAVTLSRMAGDMAEASLDFSYRVPPGFDCAALLERLRAVARGGHIEVRGSVPAARTDRRDPVVRALTAGIRLAGGEPRHKLKTATSDMNMVAEVWDVPMAAYGPGDSQLDHSADEHILLGDFARGIAVLGSALDQLAELPATTVAVLGGQS